MEYRIEYDFAERGPWGGAVTLSISIPLVYEEKRTEKLALRTYKAIKKCYGRKLTAILLYKNNAMIKGKRYGRK